MSDERLGEQLLRQNERVPATVPTIVDEITRRERRRVRVWAIATGALWVLAVAYLLGLLWFYMVLLHPRFHEFLTSEETGPAQMQEFARVLISWFKALLVWPVLLFAAAACTTIFTLASRRATLRQIQASLADISEQLKGLTAKP
jgi:type II secretory pathway component PulF